LDDRDSNSGSAFKDIRAIDYTVIIVRDMESMQRFYEDVLCFRLLRKLSPDWIEYQIGENILALSNPGRTILDAPIPNGTAAVQLAFKVSVPVVDQCANELTLKGVKLESPPTDQVFGHRTLFFRDPDGNLLEIFAEISI